MNKKLILTSFMALTIGGAYAVAPMWVRDVKISPSGDRIAFEYKGDIYSVPASGGKAVRLTDGTSYDCNPVWNPDGTGIAYSSDRNGGSDIYFMGADGSNPLRLTFNSAAETPEAFTADGKSVIFSATLQDPASSVLAPMRSNSELYTVPVTGGRISQLLPTPAVNVEFVPGTDIMVFEDVKGNEDKWRKHHTSSITRDIWAWQPSSGSFTNLTARAGEDRDPAPSPDGKTLYFLSERDGGSFNVYSMPLNGKGAATQLTDFTTHPVRFLSCGANGLLAFTYNGEIYTMRPGSKPVKVNIDVTDTGSDEDATIRFSNAEESAVSPDGKQVAFTNRGEVFVTSVEFPSTKQVTHTAAAEGQLSWGKDGRELYYTTYRTGRPTIYRAKISRKDDPNFSNATLIDEEALFPDDGVERSNPVVSPDGKKMAFLKDRNIMCVMDLASKSVKELRHEPVTNYRNGNFTMVWSPDSRWIAVEMSNPLHEPYDDIAIVNASDGKIVHITESGYFDQSPRWSADGKALLFASERYGMRNHASWGSQYDVMMVFLTKDAYDRFRLSEEDLALLKEVEKEQKKAADKKKESQKGKNDKKGKKDKNGNAGDNAAEESKDIEIDFEGLQDRIVRLTPNSSDIADFVLSKDGETLYYLSAFEGGYDLWKKDLRKGDVTLEKKLDSGNVRIQTDADGNMFLAGSTVKKFDPKSRSLKNVGISGSMKMDLAREREFMLDYVKNEARERFLLPEMPVDWDMYVDNYRRFLPHISHNADFAPLLSELLGELNVSHSGGRYYGAAAKDATASFGLLFDWNYDGDGLRVSEIVEGGPFDRATTAMKAGDIITAVNGVPVKADEDWTKLFNGILRKKTLVAFSNPRTGEKSEEVILPISTAQMNNLLYDRWVKGREAAVDSLSGGRLGYVHIRSMSDDSFRDVYSKLLGKFVGKDGIVIDTRWNGGGRLHEDIEVLFSGDKYLTQEIHGRKSSEMPSRRWNKPSIMVMGEANYSNAHGTPWVYKKKKLGKLVGMPVPGTMSSVNWIDLQDPSLLFGVPVVAFRTEEGNILENSQLEPDIKVANSPADIVRGVDAQIETAVRALLQEIDGK